MRILRTIAFLWLLAALLLAVDWICRRKDRGTDSVRTVLKEIERESIDVLAVGPSYVYCTFNPVELYRATSLRSQVLGSSGQPIEATYHYLKMALRRCRPKVVVVGASMFISSSSDQMIGDEGAAHFAADPLPLGVEKVEMLLDMRLPVAIDSYLFPLEKYHVRWKSLKAHDFGVEDIPNVPYTVHCGYRLWTRQRKNDLRQIDLSKSAPLPVPGRSTYVLGRMVRLAEISGARLVLLAAPRNGALANGRLVALHEYANRNGIAFLDLNVRFDEVGFDNATDFQDDSHLNVIGAEKATRCVGRWLTEDVGLKVSELDPRDVARWDARCIAYDRARAAGLGSTSK